MATVEMELEQAGSFVEGLLAGTGVTLGRVVGVDDEGRPLVDFPDNPDGPVPARSTVTLVRETLAAEREALLAFADGDRRKPVIVGLIQGRPVCPLPKLGKLAPKTPLEVSSDGREVVVTAYSELHLRCGRSSITLRSDGKILIDGNNVLSRAKVTNRIKGGSVQIN